MAGDGKMLLTLQFIQEGVGITGEGIFEAMPGRGTSYANWRAVMFAPADVNTPAADPEADFDGDRIVNIFEQIHGMNPTVADQPQEDVPLALVPGSVGDGFSIRFKVVQPFPDVDLGYSWSEDGVTWNSIVPASSSVAAQTGPYLTYRVNFDAPPAASGAVLLRLTADER